MSCHVCSSFYIHVPKFKARGDNYGSFDSDMPDRGMGL
jgi:hypothetical protein